MSSSQDCNYFRIDHSKELLRSIGLPTASSKAELMNRMSQCASNDLASAMPPDEDAKDCDAGGQVQILGMNSNVSSLVEGELELLRGEGDLLGRELDLRRREDDCPTPLTARYETRCASSASVSIKASSDFIGEFEELYDVFER
ncbi:hypothetical protein KM043_017895 [Ampulex compressa]|nr:hypothetical protein KM043_017895 [Ampulex compressa]